MRTGKEKKNESKKSSNLGEVGELIHSHFPCSKSVVPLDPAHYQYHYHCSLLDPNILGQVGVEDVLPQLKLSLG